MSREGRTPAGARIDTLAVHGGQEPDAATGAIQVPIYLTSTFVQEGPGRHKGFEYSRTQNPTRFALEAAVAALEGARFGAAFASGLAATTTVLSLLRGGDHVVAGDDLYGGTHRLFERVLRPLGLSFSYVDPRRPEALEAAIEPATRMVWVETPTNPLLKIGDLAAFGEICRRRKLWLCVDNTFMSPYFQRPIALGATMVVHSTTKYLNGHCDVVGGCVVTDDAELHERIKFLQNAIGAVPSPLDCYLVMRGLKTLALRMERHQQNALRVARFLEGHPAVARVLYPGLESHPQHALARRQMSGFSGMLSFELRGGLGAARRLLERVRIFSCAESLGGVESLIEHPALMTHASVPVEKRAELGIGDGLVRLSAGIEHADDLVEDLDQALG
jgi:cystathionine gamma-lyase